MLYRLKPVFSDNSNSLQGLNTPMYYKVTSLALTEAINTERWLARRYTKDYL